MSKRNRPHTLKVIQGGQVVSIPRYCKATDKVTYPDRIAADLQLEHIQLRARRTIRSENRSYECNHCSGWHLTSQDQRTQPRFGHSA